MKKIIGCFRFCDFVTMTGTFAAILGILLSLTNHFHLAILLMIVCAICDSFDGYFARKRKNTEFESTYGAELDSLSDLICFGLFPAIFALKNLDLSITKFIIPFYVLCGLIRLAYFNALSITKTNEKGYFKGVPITTVSFIIPLIYILSFINFKIYSYVFIFTLIILGILFITNIRIKKPDINKIINYFGDTKYPLYIRFIINYIIFPIFLLIISDLFYKINSFGGFALFDTFKSIINYPLAFIYILIIFILLMFFISSLCKSTTKAKFIMLIISAIFLTINDVKFIIMNSPVMLSDVNFLNTSNIGTAGLYLSTVKGVWIFKVLLKLLIMILVALIIKKSKLTEIKNNKYVRISYFLLSTLVIYIIFTGSIKCSRFMIEDVYKYDVEDVLRIENYSKIYYEEGLYQGIMFNKFTSNVFKPSGYSKNKVKELLKNTTMEKSDWGKPNIVIILSESFSDLTNIDSITFDKDLLENIHKFENQDDCLVTNTYTSTYGGQSVISEWEVQSSASSQFFIPSYIAYNEYYHKKNNKNIDLSPHIIHSLNKKGYYTKYITPWHGDSYNSKYVYNILGIDKTKYGLKGENKGIYLSDKEINKSIINELSINKNVPKLLIYATAQGHMPCSKDKYETYDVNVTSTSLNEENKDLLRCYAQGVYDADKELGNLYEEIKKINENTIVIFFGDHLPYITNHKGENIYQELPYFNTDNKDLNNLRSYTTKSVIFSNYDLKMDKSINYINLNYLGAYVYSHLDILDKEYYNFVNNMRKELPVFSRNYLYNPDDNSFTKIDNLSKNKKELLKNYKDVQYYEFFNKK